MNAKLCKILRHRIRRAHIERVKAVPEKFCMETRYVQHITPKIINGVKVDKVTLLLYNGSYRGHYKWMKKRLTKKN